MHDISTPLLETIRRTPEKFTYTTDMYIYTLATINILLKKYKVRINPEYGDDESVTDWLMLNRNRGKNPKSAVDWFRENYGTDVFIPLI